MNDDSKSKRADALAAIAAAEAEARMVTWSGESLATLQYLTSPERMASQVRERHEAAIRAWLLSQGVWQGEYLGTTQAFAAALHLGTPARDRDREHDPAPPADMGVPAAMQRRDRDRERRRKLRMVVPK